MGHDQEFSDKHVHAVVGVMLNDHGRVLALGRKHDHSELGFPGGKVEPGETLERALAREVEEEIAVRLVSAMRVYEGLDNPNGNNCVAFLITSWEGEPRSVEGPPLDWISPIELVAKSGEFSSFIASTMVAVWKHLLSSAVTDISLGGRR